MGKQGEGRGVQSGGREWRKLDQSLIVVYAGREGRGRLNRYRTGWFESHRRRGVRVCSGCLGPGGRRAQCSDVVGGVALDGSVCIHEGHSWEKGWP